MSFSWPAPDLSFLAGGEPTDRDSALFFVCANGHILQQADEQGQWRPQTLAGLGPFTVIQEHFMGQLNGVDCYAVEVEPLDGFEFVNLRLTLGQVNDTLFNLAGRALQLSDWYRNHRYCGQCGGENTVHDSDRSMVCESCRINYYPRLSPSIIVLVHREDEVLLARNHLFPPGLFSTLAGFVEPGESIEETVRREVFEEVGVKLGSLQYHGSQPWPFPNSLMLGFHAAYESGDIVCQEDEIAEARWFPLDDLPQIPGKFAISRWLIDAYLDKRGYPI